MSRFPARRGGRPRVALVVPSLNSGGAERAALNMAAAAKKLDCVVVAERAGGDLCKDPLASNVIFVSNRLERSARPARAVRLARTLRRIGADAAVSMLSPVVTAAAARMAGTCVIHWLQAPLSRTTGVTSKSVRGRLQRQALLAACSAPAIVAGATPGLCDECRRLGIPREQMALLPNGLQLPSRGAKRAGAPDEPVIVTVGRLEPQKRHDLTIRAVARILEEVPVKLVIVGSGARERELRSLVDELGVSEQVTFTGFVEAPYEYVDQADVFTLATEHEGFGNVIVEALACGVPVVVSDVPYGPRFILDGGTYGNLVASGSVTALEHGLREALSEVPISERRAAALRNRAELFQLERVASRFEEVIKLAVSSESSVPDWLREWP